MQLMEILQQPDGFTPPEVTVKIDKVYEYKSGEGENGPWSFQNVTVAGGGRLKLKNLPEFPSARTGQTVTIRANSSKTHGLTGMKVQHEQYQGKTYDQLVITNSAKWFFDEPSSNGHSAPAAQSQPELRVEQDVETYANHILACAGLAEIVSNIIQIDEHQAMQACFATIVIDTKNRGILLPKPSPTEENAPERQEAKEPESNPFDEEDEIPF